ncbi:MAG TPA: serine protease, partial [Rhodospirillales bacterium]|nr:serine protease [Rhodospirillales bacterium]
MEELPPKIPTGMQPDPKDVSFDLALALSSVVSVRTEIPNDAFTAGSLGTVRRGHGVVIAEGGLILTIGYLIIEAASIWMLDANGRAIPGDVVGYDQETGFGLIRALGPAGLTLLPIGQSGDLSVGEKVIFAGNGGRTQALKSRVVSIREFAGYWEYLLDQAIFTSPPHPFWGGGALIGADGTLLGIGSLFVQDSATPSEPLDGNMVVPIDILEPIIKDLMTSGRSQKPKRPWLGMFSA